MQFLHRKPMMCVEKRLCMEIKVDYFSSFITAEELKWKVLSENGKWN